MLHRTPLLSEPGRNRPATHSWHAELFALGVNFPAPHSVKMRLQTQSIPSLRKSNGFLQPGWVQCSLFSIEGGCARYPKHAPKSGFSAIRKECNWENYPSFTVVRVHVVRGYMPICRKIVFGFFALGGLHHPPGRGGARGRHGHVLSVIKFCDQIFQIFVLRSRNRDSGVYLRKRKTRLSDPKCIS